MEKINALELPDIPEPFFEKANTLLSELNTPGIDLITKLEMVYRKRQYLHLLGTRIFKLHSLVFTYLQSQRGLHANRIYE